MMIRKIAEITFAVAVLLASLTVFAGAEGIDGQIGSEMYDSLPEDTEELFEALGMDSAEFDDILDTSASDVLSLARRLVTGGIESPVKSLVRLLAVIVIMAVLECFVPGGDRMSRITEMVGSLVCVMSVAPPLISAVKSAIASIAVSEDFMLGLIPVLTAVVSASGNPTLAISFRSIAFAAAQVISSVAEACAVPLVGAVLALDITGSLMPSYRISGITDLIKKTVTSVLSFTATLYVSFLGIKGALANAADTVAGRGMKLVISSAVPVVGGALSEAYSGIMGSLVLVKSTVGIFGIAAIALINLPSCVQLLFWVFALRIGAAAGELFNRQGISKLLGSMASAITLLNVVLLFNAVLFIISTALILIIKAG